MVTSVYQLSVIPPNPVHIHPEAQEGQACGLGNQSPSSLSCRSDFELRGQEDLKGKKNHLIHIDAATSISKDNSCGPRLLFFFFLSREICRSLRPSAGWGQLRREQVKRVDTPAWSCE